MKPRRTSSPLAENAAGTQVNLPIEKLDKRTRRIVQRALYAKKKAYAPYSKYRVGAALIDSKKKLHTGCNVENASYGGSICAERVALTKMVSRGAKEFSLMVVAASSDEPVFPCGICLQFMAEFGPKARVVAVNRSGSLFREEDFQSLFPSAFSPAKLKG